MGRRSQSRLTSLLTLICVFLIVCAPRSTVAQGGPNLAPSESGISVGVEPLYPRLEEQPGCPLTLSFQRRDDSEPETPRLFYNLQNVGLKPIQAYAIELSAGESSRVFTSAQGELPLEVGEVVEYSFETDATTEVPATLSVDYVRFLDGDAWGEDTSERADAVDGMLEGIHRAVSEAKRMADAPSLEQSFEIVERQRLAGTLEPLIAEDKSESWRNGFSVTYQSALGNFYRIFKEGGLTALRRVFADYARTSSRR